MSLSIAAVVPCYNGEAFVARALDSIAAQTVPVGEIVFVDDGSSDGSAAAAEAWSAAHPDISMQLLRQVNGGVSAARNLGIGAAQAAWIALLDVDDVWEPTHNEIFAGLAAEADDCVLMAADARRLSVGDDAELATFLQASDVAALIEAALPSHRHDRTGAVYRRLLAGSFIATCSSLFRRSAFERIGGFELGRKFAEDRRFWLQLFSVGPALFSPEVASRVYYHDANATHARNNVEAALAHFDLNQELLRDRDAFGIDARGIEVLRARGDELLRNIRYQASRSGLGEMLDIRRRLGPDVPFGYGLKDWLRGGAASLRAKR